MAYLNSCSCTAVEPVWSRRQWRIAVGGGDASIWGNFVPLHIFSSLPPRRAGDPLFPAPIHCQPCAPSCLGTVAGTCGRFKPAGSRHFPTRRAPNNTSRCTPSSASMLMRPAAAPPAAAALPPPTTRARCSLTRPGITVAWSSACEWLLPKDSRVLLQPAGVAAVCSSSSTIPRAHLDRTPHTCTTY